MRAVVIILAFAFFSCNSQDDIAYIKQHQWKAGYPNHDIGDWLSFEGILFRISNDTIFSNDTAIAKVISFERRGYGRGNKLLLQLIRSKARIIFDEK